MQQADTVRAVTELTHDWVDTFTVTSGQLASSAVGEFALNGAAALPPNIPQPSLQVTPRVYRKEWFSDIPYTAGYCKQRSRTLTPHADQAWFGEVPLWVDPTPLSFAEYEARAAEPNPWADGDLSTRRLAAFWRSTPQKIRRHLEAQDRWTPDAQPAQPWVVYRALGALPPLAQLPDAAYTFDLRLDPVLRTTAGQPSDSCRSANFANTEEQYGDYLHRFATPYELQSTGAQRHVPSYELRPEGFYSSDAQTRGWRNSPPAYEVGLVFKEWQTGDKPTLMVIHLAGAAAMAQAAA
jgi:hypothetical protein